MTARRIVPQTAVKLDDAAAPDDNTDLDASTTKHGLARKLSGVLTDTLRGDGTWTPPNPPQRGLFYANDCLQSTLVTPWMPLPLSSGTATQVTSDSNHPGVVQLRGSGTANGGFALYALHQLLLLAGGESTDMIFRVITTAGTTCYLGLHDSSTATAPVDGAWINISGTTLLGRCKNNAGPTDTGTSYEITQNVWYRARIVVNAAATRVDFYLYTCADGVQVWTDNVQANIPTATGRECGHLVTATNSGTGSAYLLDIDYLSLAINRIFAR